MSCTRPVSPPNSNRSKQEAAKPNFKFVNAYSSEAVIPLSNKQSTGAFRQEVKWIKETGSTGKLVDYTYPSTGGSTPSYTFSEAATPVSGTLIASHITQLESGGKKIPIFQYYSYATESNSGTEAGLNTLSSEPLAIPKGGLGATEAGTAASVLIRFSTSAANKAAGLSSKAELGDSIELSNQVTLAFSAPKSESTTADGPCQ